MIAKLPYPGFSWSFTQHAVGLVPETLYKLLECAAQFEGNSLDFGKKITELMVAADILTVNEREGQPDAWRDYQQILAELGLIYSTRICPALTITEIGHLFLAGEIGFSELVGMQAFRYQYPNGQKSTIQSKLKKTLSDEGESIPDSLIELQVNHGVLIKPAILIMRVITGLFRKGYEPYLTLDECKAFLLCCKKNDEWLIALDSVIKYRASSVHIGKVNDHSRRNIQDWFKFLARSDFFISKNANTIQFSELAISQIDKMDTICNEQEKIESFWIPQGFENKDKLIWFKFFGANSSIFNYLSQGWSEEDYIIENYIAGTDDDNFVFSENKISLKPLDFDFLSRNTQVTISSNMEELVNNVHRGIQKRHSKTLLHDSIVKELAEKFLIQGASVESDADSVDLLATWPSGQSAIFEVKTISRNNMQGRIRTAVGQVQEYAYRYEKLTTKVADKVVVINTILDSSSWQTDFLTNYLNIGVICKTSFDYCAYSPRDASSKKFWLT